ILRWWATPVPSFHRWIHCMRLGKVCQREQKKLLPNAVFSAGKQAFWAKLFSSIKEKHTA
ncbi:MAG: hypothetical protein IKM64_07030, partial [Clostridia bacterium]|nr:hypothetical protein [Clostridia bacterium]